MKSAVSLYEVNLAHKGIGSYTDSVRDIDCRSFAARSPSRKTVLVPLPAVVINCSNQSNLTKGHLAHSSGSQ